ncbi:MAG TPA: alpha/beta hydrolase [Mycobacteriales bacterium]|nr:alpha/beta hydrolase [Mycobacteriales bacterium]
MTLLPYVHLPAGVQRRRLATPRGSFALLDLLPAEGRAAEPTPRPPALLVPGYTGSKEDFTSVLAGIAAAGHRAIAVDLRGQHETAGGDDPAAYTVAALAADVRAVAAALGDGPVHLVGHSFGGLVCRRAVLDGPGVARSLTLLCSGPAAIGGHRAQVVAMLAPVLADGGLPAVWAAMEALAAADRATAARPAEVAAFLHRRFHASHPVGLDAMGRALLTEPDHTAELAAAGVPVLVAYGEHDDAWTPAEQAAMAHRLGATARPIERAGHSPAAEAPAATVRVLTDFWAVAEDGRSGAG